MYVFRFGNPTFHTVLLLQLLLQAFQETNLNSTKVERIYGLSLWWKSQAWIYRAVNGLVVGSDYSGWINCRQLVPVVIRRFKASALVLSNAFNYFSGWINCRQLVPPVIRRFDSDHSGWINYCQLVPPVIRRFDTRVGFY